MSFRLDQTQESANAFCFYFQSFPEGRSYHTPPTAHKGHSPLRCGLQTGCWGRKEKALQLTWLKGSANTHFVIRTIQTACDSVGSLRRFQSTAVKNKATLQQICQQGVREQRTWRHTGCLLIHESLTSTPGFRPGGQPEKAFPLLPGCSLSVVCCFHSILGPKGDALFLCRHQRPLQTEVRVATAS